MANQKQLDILHKQGVKTWNTWRAQNQLIPIDFSYADLSKADLSYADLSKADLSYTNLSLATLNKADLNYANLNYANLSYTNFIGATLCGADLSKANLYRTNLYKTDLSLAILSRATLINTTLIGANLNRAIAAGTIFASLDLRSVKGLETIRHQGPSEISVSTFERSNGEIPDIFLHGVGLSNESVSYVHLFLQNPIQYYSCFISYSSTDQEFAERLYADLQQQGIRCWFAPHSLKIGDHFPTIIEEAIHVYDKLLLILSESSVRSEWVEDEVRSALEKEERFRKEQHQERTVLFPIQIDQTIEHASTQWAAKLRRTRHIGNFTKWKDYDAYLKSFQRLMRDLKAEPPEEAKD